MISPPEPSSFRLIFSLGAAGFLSGILLVTVFLYTKPLIEKNKTEAMQEAIFKVLPGCDSISTLSIQQGKVIVADPEAKGSNKEEELNIYAGYSTDGKLIGFAIPAEEPGFQDIIKAIYGYDPAKGEIIGFEVLESKETPGLGDKIYKDSDFQENFRSLYVSPIIKGVKKGQKSADNEIETITGATISSKAIVNMLNRSVEDLKEIVDSYYVQLENIAND